MIDTQSIDELIKQQIQSVINQHVTNILGQSDWLAQLENKIIQDIQSRIVAKFSNISTVPDLITTVQSSVEKLFNEGHIPGIGDYVDQDKVTRTIDSSMTELVDAAISNMVLDLKWISKIENMANQRMTDRMIQELSKFDLNSAIVTQIDAGIDRWQDRLKKDFVTNGIVDKATTTQLTIEDNVVIAENDFVTNDLFVLHGGVVTGDLIVDNLIVKKLINTDNDSWDELANKISADVLKNTTEQWKEQLAIEVLELAKTNGINFDSILLGDVPLIADGSLNPTVVTSNLRKLGILQELTVDGFTKLNDTVHVNKHRVGINTENPEMALSVWDEEVAVIAGKLASQVGYLGTARLQTLAIGVNRIPQITIDTTGLTVVKQLQVDRFKIGFASSVPGYSGTRGDLIFNSDPQAGAPFGWVCLGSFQWQPLKGL